MGNVVGRDDTLYARMKQRDLDGHDTMWEPIFMDDASMGLGDQKNKVELQSRDACVIYLILKMYKIIIIVILSPVMRMNLIRLSSGRWIHMKTSSWEPWTSKMTWA